VYGETAFALAQAELARLEPRLVGPERSRIGGVDYLLVAAEDPLDDDRLAVVSDLSSLQALFELEGDGRLRPLPWTPRSVLDEDILTIQRYAGKTNEAFTHLLVNVALAACAGFERLRAGERLRLLDPACGRGTTLNRAAVYGMDASGIDLDQRDIEAYDQFLTTWLRDKRLKHTVERATLRKGRPAPAHRVTITYGEGKDVRTHRVVDLVHDDTTRARDHFKAGTMDVIACDLPYGVQHGSQRAEGTLQRGPDELLESALPVWRDLLRPGGAAALSWNRRTLARPRLTALVESAGFDLVPAGDDDMVHRVDRAITRDVLVAVRRA
jgi:SAM-dependent methyltransferase